MNRRTAIASSVSLMATVVVGGVAFASLGGIDVLGFGVESTAASVDIVETSPTPTTEPTVDVLLVDTTTTVASTPDTTAGGQVGNAPGATTAAPTGGRAGDAPGTTAPAAGTTPPTAAPTVPPTVAPTAPKTTVAPATTAPAPASTLPAGVPKDWPPGKPIPPKPVGCVDGQLEDNGVWNCQH